MSESAQRFPLSWPTGWTRTNTRSRANFRRRQNVLMSRLTVGDGLARLSLELRRLGGTQVVISSNLQTRNDGLPYSNQPKVITDPGVAVYFKMKGKPRVLACDKWDSAADNMAAIAGHISAIRTVDRYGVGTLEQAFAGYAALPAQAASWFTVLEFADPPKTWEVIESRFKSLARIHHPDAGGNSETMGKINAAYDTAREEFGR